MAEYHPFTRRSSGWPGRKPSFLLMMALVCLAGFYAFGSRRLDPSRFDREEPGPPIMGQAWVVDGDSLRIAGVSIRLDASTRRNGTRRASTATARPGAAG